MSSLRRHYLSLLLGLACLGSAVRCILACNLSNVGEGKSWETDGVYWTSITGSDPDKTTCLNKGPGADHSWTLNLGAVFLIDHVLLTTLSGVAETFSVEVVTECSCAQENFQPMNCTTVCATRQNAEPSENTDTDVINITCEENDVRGRFVRVRNNDVSRMTFCGVKVMGCPLDGEKNYALGQPAVQSSVHANGIAALAVDGDRSTKYWTRQHTKCTHTSHTLTKKPYYHWWQVQMEDVVPVSRIVIYNRMDCCTDRLRDFTVSVGREDSSGHVEYRECFYHEGPAGEVVHIHCASPVCGQIVRVAKQVNDSSALTLCEVEVYVDGIPNQELTTPEPPRTQQTTPQDGVKGHFSEDQTQDLRHASAPTVAPPMKTKPPACPCRCVRNDPLPSSLTSKELQDTATSQIARELHVPADVTGKAVRKRNSANDDRISAFAAGVVAVCVMAAVFLSVTLPDCVTLVTYLAGVWGRDRNA